MSKGSILIYTSAAGQAAPLPGVTLTVTDAGGSVRARLVTDADGFAEAADLPAPDAAYSLDAANTTVQPYALYRIEAAPDGWQPLVLNGVQVFDAQQTVARLISVMRSLMAVERADVCVIMIDAVEGVTEQDTKIAGEAHNAGKACIIVVNKWDLIEKDGKTMDQYTERVRIGLSYMPYAPVLFLSAKTGARVHKLFDCINDVYEQNGRRIPTGQLNSLLAEATARVQPPTDKGRRLKIYYMTQSGVRPPTFVCFCNDAQLFHFSYQRYLENQIRDVYGLKGTPIRMIVRERGGKEE